MNRQLGQMAALTQLVLDTELARLRALSEDLAVQRAKADALTLARENRSQALKGGGGEHDLACLTGQDLRWLDWMAGERARINSGIAQAAALREEQRKVASRAFGRAEAIVELGRRAAEEKRIIATRKSAARD